jgi:hypothetical protein
MFLGKILRRVLFIPVMNRSGARWMFYQGVVTLPITVWELMDFHLDFYAFVSSLNGHSASRRDFN